MIHYRQHRCRSSLYDALFSLEHLRTSQDTVRHFSRKRGNRKLFLVYKMDPKLATLDLLDVCIFRSYKFDYSYFYLICYKIKTGIVEFILFPLI